MGRILSYHIPPGHRHTVIATIKYECCLEFVTNTGNYRMFHGLMGSKSDSDTFCLLLLLLPDHTDSISLARFTMSLAGGGGCCWTRKPPGSITLENIPLGLVPLNTSMYQACVTVRHPTLLIPKHTTAPCVPAVLYPIMPSPLYGTIGRINRNAIVQQ